MVHFYDLPYEIRQMIYAQCLVVGEIHPYNSRDTSLRDRHSACAKTGCDLPTVALLQVSKTIRKEAEPALYERNMVQLGSAEFSQRFFERCLNTSERKLWLKSVSMWLDDGEITEADQRAVLDTLFPERAYTEVPWAKKVQDAYKQYIGETVWPRKVLPLLDSCKLNTLVMDFSEALCQADCCKMCSHAVQSFRKGFAMGLPARFVIQGLGRGAKASRKLVQRWTSRRMTDLDRKLVLDIFSDEE